MAAHEYVKYIQYTIAAGGYYAGSIDGQYGPRTTAGVKSFQIDNNERYIDGKVDSETKWYLAKFWLDLKSANIDLFNAYKNYASADIKKYIEKVESMGLSSSIGTDKVYRKTTFTGVRGPQQGSDVIFFEVPSSIISLNSILVIPDSDPRWRNFKVIAVGWSSTYSENIFSYPGLETLDLSAVSSDIEIPMNNKLYADARYMRINVLGGPISGLGYGEGFGIKQICCKGLAQGADVTTVVNTEDPITVTVNVDFTSRQELINPSTSALIDLSTLSSIKNQPTQYISSISYSPDGSNINTITLTSGNSVNLNTINYENGELKIDNFSENTISGSLSLSNLSVTDVTSSGQSVSGSPISIRQESNRIYLETSSTYYGDSITRTTNIDLTSGFRLKNKSGQLMPEGKNTINYGDGILMFCDANGNTVGFPTASQIRASISNPTSFSQEERDLAYGYFTVTNNQSSAGLRYGFYDLNTNEFLGTTLSYIDFYSRTVNSNFSNIYIAICALDADGLSGDSEFIGSNNSTTFVPAVIPMKYIVPIYSVNYTAKSAIRVNDLNENLSNFDAWELPVSNGSFTKEINIASNKRWSDWKSNYSGKKLLCEYSTTDLQQISWSKIYGRGHYDVIDETPIIIDNKTIRVRRNPILSWNHPSTYSQSIAGIMKAELSVYVRSSISSSWTLIDYSNILDIDCDKGIIKFESSLVPSSDKLIKVSYVSKNANALIRQVNSDPIPLNPFLNASSIQYNKPMYIYITPVNIYKTDPIAPLPGQVINYQKITDYQYKNPINFTYNHKLFDELSNQYDPFALCIAIIYVTNNPAKQKPEVNDLRIRGGGIKADLENSQVINDIPEILSHWDTYSSDGEAYMDGGYVIVRIPEEVKQNFANPNEIYSIIRDNLTAGIIFDLQNTEGDSWI